MHWEDEPDSETVTSDTYSITSWLRGFNPKASGSGGGIFVWVGGRVGGKTFPRVQGGLGGRSPSDIKISCVNFRSPECTTKKIYKIDHILKTKNHTKKLTNPKIRFRTLCIFLG